MKTFKGVRTIVVEEAVVVDAEDALEAWQKITSGGDDITITHTISEKITAAQIKEKNYYIDYAARTIKEKTDDELKGH